MVFLSEPATGPDCGDADLLLNPAVPLVASDDNRSVRCNPLPRLRGRDIARRSQPILVGKPHLVGANLVTADDVQLEHHDGDRRHRTHFGRSTQLVAERRRRAVRAREVVRLNLDREHAISEMDVAPVIGAYRQLVATDLDACEAVARVVLHNRQVADVGVADHRLVRTSCLVERVVARGDAVQGLTDRRRGGDRSRRHEGHGDSQEQRQCGAERYSTLEQRDHSFGVRGTRVLDTGVLISPWIVTDW